MIWSGYTKLRIYFETGVMKKNVIILTDVAILSYDYVTVTICILHFFFHIAISIGFQ